MAKNVFGDLVRKAKEANHAKHGPIHSPHEGLALILEEVSELKSEVFKRKRKGDPLRFLNELVEIAALCERFAEDLVGGYLGRTETAPAFGPGKISEAEEPSDGA